MGNRKKKNERKTGGNSSEQHIQTRSSKSSESSDSKGGKKGNNSNKRNEIRGKAEGHSLHNDYEFRRTLQDGSKTIKEMESDGNCLFRSLSDQLYNDYGKRHEQVRCEICDFLEANEDKFAAFLFLDEDEEDVCKFEEYVSRMRNYGEWGGDVEVVCASRLYRRRITIYSVSGVYNIEPNVDELPEHDLLLSYHENSHYNSIFDENIFKQYSGRQKVSNPSKSNKTKNLSETSDENTSTSVHHKIEQSNGHKKNKRVSQQRNNLCSCGSGLRYKKCCLPKEKMKERQDKFNEKYGLDSEMDKKVNDSDEDIKLSEGFRVMTI